MDATVRGAIRTGEHPLLVVDLKLALDDLPSVQSMAKEGEPDSSRPRIEFYRSDKEVILFLPLK